MAVPESTRTPWFDIGIFAALIALTGATVAACHIDLGPFHTAAGLGIAAAKAALVILFFMHVWRSKALTWVVALSGLFWLGILLGLTMTDFLSRNWAM
jgi:cytochrome c oxidase subunit IV